MDQLNYFMRERELPRPMRMVLRDYFLAARRVHQLNDDSELISMMSPLLEGQVAVATNRPWLQKIWYFKDIDQTSEGRFFVVGERRSSVCSQHVTAPFTHRRGLCLRTLPAAMSKRLVLRAYVTNERLPVGQLYILRRGLVVKMWRFLGRGTTWGEDVILDSPELIDHSQAVALTYCETYTLRRADMEAALREAPAVRQLVRRAARKLQIQRAMLKYLCMKWQGRLPKSFSAQSAAQGYSEVYSHQDHLSVDQKLTHIVEVRCNSLSIISNTLIVGVRITKTGRCLTHRMRRAKVFAGGRASRSVA